MEVLVSAYAFQQLKELSPPPFGQRVLFAVTARHVILSAAKDLGIGYRFRNGDPSLRSG
jgi:hypothetical protein